LLVVQYINVYKCIFRPRAFGSLSNDNIKEKLDDKANDNIKEKFDEYQYREGVIASVMTNVNETKSELMQQQLYHTKE